MIKLTDTITAYINFTKREINFIGLRFSFKRYVWRTLATEITIINGNTENSLNIQDKDGITFTTVLETIMEIVEENEYERLCLKNIKPIFTDDKNIVIELGFG